MFSGERNIAPPSVSQTSQGILTTKKFPSMCVLDVDVHSELKRLAVVDSALFCGNTAGFELFRSSRMTLFLSLTHNSTVCYRMHQNNTHSWTE